MSDKELIKQEIERLINDKSDGKHVAKADIIAPKGAAYLDILNFINSLSEEPASEDLEEEIGKYTTNHLLKKRNHSTGVYHLTQKDCDDIAHHFAEWQREKDIKLEKIDDLEKFAQKWAYSNYHKELDEINCDCLYSGVKKGAEWQKQQDEELFSKDTWNYIEENYPNITEEEKLRLYDVSIKSRLAGANTIKQQMKEALQTEYEKGRFDMREELITAAKIKEEQQ